MQDEETAPESAPESALNQVFVLVSDSPGDEHTSISLIEDDTETAVLSIVDLFCEEEAGISVTSKFARELGEKLITWADLREGKIVPT